MELERDTLECELNPEVFITSKGGIGGCNFKCPYPSYNNVELRVMWALYCLPALLSFPLNVAVIVQRNRGKHRTKPPVVLSSVCAVLWFLVDPLWSLVIFTDVACGSHAETGSRDSALCKISSLSIHLLQAIMYLSSALAVEIVLSVVVGVQKSRREQIARMLLWASMLLPGVAAVAVLIMEEGTSAIDSARQSFTCEPRITTARGEWLVIHCHFCVGAAISSCCAFASQFHVGKIAERTARSRATSVINVTVFNLTARIKKMQKKRTLKLATMAVFNAALFVVYTVTQISSSMQLDAYAQGLDQWFFSLATAGGDFSTTPPGDRPSVVLKAASYFALSCVPLFNGLLFADVGSVFENANVVGWCCSHRRYLPDQSSLVSPQQPSSNLPASPQEISRSNKVAVGEGASDVVLAQSNERD
jgi:hypothetical protein